MRNQRILNFKKELTKEYIRLTFSEFKKLNDLENEFAFFGGHYDQYKSESTLARIENLSFNLVLIIFDNFEYLYKDEELVNELNNYELIHWQRLSYAFDLNIEWIKKYKDMKWDYVMIGSHNNFKIDWVYENPELPWNWNEGISDNFNLELSWIENNLDKDWNFSLVSKKCELSWIKKYPDWNWDWKEISVNQNFGEVLIDEFKDKDLYWNYVTRNKNFKLSWIDKCPDKEWYWSRIYKFHNIDLNFIKKYKKNRYLVDLTTNNNLNLEWLEYLEDKLDHWYYFSKHPNLNIKWLERFPDKSWDWEDICSHRNLDIEWFKIIPKDKVDRYLKQILNNPSFTIEMFEKIENVHLNNRILCNPKLQLNWIEKYLEYKKSPEYIYNINELINISDIELIMANQNFNIEWINKFPEWKWNMEKISSHSNLKIEWIEKYPDLDWEWYLISKNSNFKTRLVN